MKQVFLTFRLPEPHRSRLRGRSRSGVAKARLRVTRDLSRAEGILCLLRDRVDFDAAPRLRVVSVMAVGYENVDVAEATRRGILVTNTPGVLTETTADLAFALLMAVARRIVEGDGDVRAGRFRGWGPFDYLGQDVHGATLGIVGPGRIGKALAKRARGFGMKVCFADRRKSSLPRVLRASDFVSLHCPLTPQTRHLIGKRELAMMKKSAVLINTTRGPVVDESALVRALRSGTIAGAGLDVYEREPRVPASLRRMKNVVLLPHIGSASRATRDAMASLAVDNLIAGLSGRRPPHAVNELQIRSRRRRKSS